MKEDNYRWHGSHHYSDRLHFVFILFLFLGIITLIFSYFALGSNRYNYRDPSSNNSITPVLSPTPTEEAVFCTQDAKQCPDGSFVGRVGPNCEFAPCPGE